MIIKLIKSKTHKIIKNQNSVIISNKNFAANTELKSKKSTITDTDTLILSKKGYYNQKYNYWV